MYLFNNLRKCSSCIKNDVCKYKKEIEKFELNLPNSIPDFIEVELKCKHYSTWNYPTISYDTVNPIYRSPSDQTISDQTITISNVNENSLSTDVDWVRGESNNELR